MDKYELVERYEALGDENDFLAARRLFEQNLTGQSSALDRQYGYLLECHGRRTLRRAVDQYQQAMSLDPDQDKVQYQWMHAKAALGEPEDAVTRYRNRVADSPGDVRWLRLPSGACLQARDFSAAAEVIATGLGLAPEDPILTYDRGEVKAARGLRRRSTRRLAPRARAGSGGLRPGVYERLPARAGGQAGRGGRGVAAHPGVRRSARLGTDGHVAEADA